MKNLGDSLFTSQEYINRNQTDSKYVVTYLYESYLMRWLFGEFLTGAGPRVRRFDSTSVITQNLRSSPDVNTHRQRFCASGKNNYNSSDLTQLQFGRNAKDGPLTAGLLNEGRQFVGSFELRIKRMRGGGAAFVARNETSLWSGLYHISGVTNVTRPGVLQTTTQYYWWIEGTPCGR